MSEIEYLTDKNGQPKAVIIPIHLWRQLFPKEKIFSDKLFEKLEYSCFNLAMNEAKQTP